MTMVRLSTVHIRAALALRLATQLATPRLAAAYSTERERMKDAIGQKKTAEQASRPAERLRGGDTSSSQKPTSASGGGGAAQNPPADETVESGEPFSHGEREADKQTKHGQDSPPPSGQREPQPEYAGRGKLSVGASPSSAERDQGVRNRDVGAVQDEDEEKKKKKTDGEEAGRISRESRGQGGYSQTSMPPRTGAGLSSSCSGSAWLSSIVSRSIFGGGGGGGGAAFVATAPVVVVLLASAGGRGLSTSAVALLRKKLSTEEENELGVRGQRPDGSSPQSSDPNSSANSDSEFDPAPAAARSKTTERVGPSYERRASTGMPPSSVEDEMRASKSKDGALGQAGRGGDGAFDSLTARKQPQKGKGVWASVRDAVTPEEEGGKRDAGAGGGVLKGLKGLKGLKEGVQQVLGQSKKKQ
ncbi:hypothetical protein OC842_005165 [Tilletia horrida]|uniref:Uncharacterized protein n=1 Tax=Tilletia horrida TaxID=155126 RepID=A0AAN6GAC3_9BASI|nr:hypothetical protein OC842_005165 [Tilletia horrida]